jgi:protein SCO1/2
MKRLGRVGRRSVAVAVVCAAAAGSAGGVLAARLVSHPGGPSLPAYHGQLSWASGRRPAPNFTLQDQQGRRFSLSSLRGTPVLLTFLDSRCTSDCPIEARELAVSLRRVPASRRPVVVVVSVDPVGDTSASIAKAVRKWGLDGPWTLRWLNGGQASLTAVWRSYGIGVQAASNDIVHGMALYLIDRAGDERTAYLFPFLPGFVTTDLKRLASEA